jgi:predicted permease
MFMTLWRRIVWWTRQRRADAELAAEIEFHRSARQAALERDGVPASQAVAASRRAMGNVRLAREDARGIWLWPVLERTWQDIRYGARSLAHSPGFTLVAISTLTLGIGVNTAMFSVVNAVLLRPLPYADPDRIVLIWTADPARNIHEGATSFPTFTDWRNENRHFVDLAFWREHAANLTAGGEPERVAGAFASANLFSLLGVNPALGRTFSGAEELRREPVVVLSHGLWKRRFGGNAAAIGQWLEMDGRRLQVIGVMPEGFYFPAKEVQHWKPATLMAAWSPKPAAAERSWGNRFAELWRVVGRLKPDATARDAQAGMDAIARRLADTYPSTDPDFVGYRTELVPMLQQITGRSLQVALWILFGAVGFVLLIACANVANLVLARGAARTRELGIRAALGAGRGRLVQQLLIENFMLAMCAGWLGALAAGLGVRAAASVARGIPRLDEIAVDASVLAFMAAVSLVAGSLFGIMPAWKLSRGDPGDALKERTGAAGGPRLSRARGVLVIVECTLAVTLLAGAGLLIRSLLVVRAVDPGFDTRNVLLVRVNLPLPLSPAWRRQEWEMFGQIFERIEAIPGVRGAGAITSFMAANNPEEAVTIEGRPQVPDRQESVLINTEDVTPGFFQAVGVPLLRGRFFTDQEQNAPIAIVNESFARRFLPGADAVGKRFKEGGPDAKAAWITIVGVIGDMHRQGLERQALPEFFFPSTEPTMDLAIRTSVDPVSVAFAVREAVRSTYAQAIVQRIATVDQTFEDLGAQRRFQTAMMTLFAMAALVLSAVGVYGLLHFAVAQRTHEFGVRLALGASSGDLLRLVLGEGLRLPVAGLALGLTGAFALTRVLRHLLFEVSATDPVTFAAVAALLLAVAFVACWLPARRAARVDPIVALRCE